ncbi:MAG TPA: hypothetical protein VFZ77_24860, partial [Acidimicrobiales bacterium]
AEIGRRAADEIRVRPPSGDAIADIVTAMARQGFDPEVRRSGGHTEVVLRACPFASAARAGPDTVCSLHLGLAEGLAGDTDVVVEELVAHDPRRAGCRLRLRLAGQPQGGARRAPGSRLSRPRPQG